MCEVFEKKKVFNGDAWRYKLQDGWFVGCLLMMNWGNFVFSTQVLVLRVFLSISVPDPKIRGVLKELSGNCCVGFNPWYLK